MSSEKKACDDLIDFDEALKIFDMNALAEDCKVDDETFLKEGKKIWKKLNELRTEDVRQYNEFIKKNTEAYQERHNATKVTNDPMSLLKEKRSMETRAAQNKENLTLSTNTSLKKVTSKAKIIDITETKSKLKRGFLNKSSRKPLYKKGSSEGSKKSFLQKCKIVDLSKQTLSEKSQL